MDSTHSNPVFEVISDDTLNHFFEASQDLLCIAGFDGYFKRVNPMVSQVLGYSLDELYASPINFFVHPDDQQITDYKRSALKSQIPLLNFENRYLTKAGDIVWLSWTSIPDQEKEMVFAIAKNITYKKRMEEDRNKQLTYLTELSNRLRKGIYMTSHDLRSPVGSVLFAASMLQHEPQISNEATELVNILKTSADSLSKMLNDYVDNLLNYDVFDIETTELSFSEVLDFVKKSLSQLINFNNAEIVSDFFEAPVVVFNRALLESVLLNLISNSIKYAKENESPHIFISSRIESGKTILIVRDEGMGFDMEKVGDTIFDLKRGFTTTTTSKGLGLYLIHSHITSMGGTIELESAPNEGATFIIRFK